MQPELPMMFVSKREWQGYNKCGKCGRHGRIRIVRAVENHGKEELVLPCLFTELEVESKCAARVCSMPPLILKISKRPVRPTKLRR